MNPPRAPGRVVNGERLEPGDRVRVRRLDVSGHVRTPFYLRGVVGQVDQRLGAFPNPEWLAYHNSRGPDVPLTRVRFRASDVFGDYAGPGVDVITADIYEHWLERTS